MDTTDRKYCRMLCWFPFHQRTPGANRCSVPLCTGGEDEHLLDDPTDSDDSAVSSVCVARRGARRPRRRSCDSVRSSVHVVAPVQKLSKKSQRRAPRCSESDSEAAPRPWLPRPLRNWTTWIPRTTTKARTKESRTNSTVQECGDEKDGKQGFKKREDKPATRRAARVARSGNAGRECAKKLTKTAENGTDDEETGQRAVKVKTQEEKEQTLEEVQPTIAVAFTASLTFWAMERFCAKLDTKKPTTARSCNDAVQKFCNTIPENVCVQCNPGGFRRRGAQGLEGLAPR